MGERKDSKRSTGPLVVDIGLVEYGVFNYPKAWYEKLEGMK